MTNEPIEAFRQELSLLVRTLQIIVAVLVLSCVTFLGVVKILIADGGPQAANQVNQAALPLPVVLGVVVMAIIARLIVPRALTTASIRKIADGSWQISQSSPSAAGSQQQTLLDQYGDAARLWYVYMTKTIIGAALLEGAAFLAIVSYMLDNSPVALACAVVLIVGTAAHFPTVDRVCRWLETQLRFIKEQRQMSGLKT